MGARYHEGGLGGAQHKLYGAPVGASERARHIGEPGGRLCDSAEAFGLTRLTQSAFNSSRASRAIASGGALGSSFFGAGGRKTKRELKIKFALVPATIPRKAAIA